MKGVFFMAMTLVSDSISRRGTVIANDSGTSFNAFSGVINSTLSADTPANWMPLYSGIQSLVSGNVSSVRLTTTDNLIPSLDE